MICMNQGRQRHKHLLFTKARSIVLGQHLQIYLDL